MTVLIKNVKAAIASFVRNNLYIGLTGLVLVKNGNGVPLIKVSQEFYQGSVKHYDSSKQTEDNPQAKC